MVKYVSNQMKTHEDKIRKVCNGNKSAESFCVAYLTFLDMIDNIYDDDKEEGIDPRQLSSAILGFITNLSFNQFWIENKHSLYPIIVNGSAAWVDSETLKQSSDDQLQDAADVLKGYYSEVLYHIAYLTGGADHMFSCTQEFRGFDFER